MEYDANIGWRSKNAWPSTQSLPHFKQTAIEYFDSVKALAYKMNEYVALSYFNVDEWFGAQPLPALRLIHYLPIVSDIENGRFAAGQHTDYGMLTFLVTDGNAGLQIMHNDQWFDIADSEMHGGDDGNSNELVIVVNIGDELQRVSNDHYLSTKHRVIMKHAIHRYSMAFFWEPNLDAIVQCVPSICDESDDSKEGAKYSAITHREHLTRKFTQAFSNEYGKQEL